jgi:hypothetical protein
VTCDADTESGAGNMTGDVGTEPRGSDSSEIAQDDYDRYPARLFEINQQGPVAKEPDCQRSESFVTQISSVVVWRRRNILIVWSNNARQGTWSAGWWMGRPRSKPLPIAQVSRSSMVPMGPDGPTFHFPNWYRQSSILSLGILLVLLLVFFVVKKPLGGILQAVLTFVVPTYQARKHAGWDLRLESSVCWVCTMCTIIMGSLLTGLLLLIDLYQWTILPGAACFGLPGTLCEFDSIPYISPDALRMSALLFGVNLLALLIKFNLCPFPSWKTAERSRPPKTRAATSRALSGAVCLLCLLIVRSYLGNAGLMYVLFTTLGHVVSENSLHTNLSQLPCSIILWLLVTWLVSSFWISSQSHNDSHTSLSNTNPVLKRWRVIVLAGLAILGLFYLPCQPFYPVSDASAGMWTVVNSVNHTNWHPAEYTLWLGTRALRESATLDSDPYLAPDLQYTLQLRVGMPAGKTPSENEDSDTEAGRNVWRVQREQALDEVVSVYVYY